jgi:S-DNA-T family DNA segregation ATPase FtsK/SpoIIIE
VEAEVVALGLLAFAALLEVSLASYSPADPVWGFGEAVENLCGPIGAFVAFGLAGTLGWASHVLPVAGVVVALRYLRGLPVRARWVPIAAWSVFWISVAGTLDVLHRVAPAHFPDQAGGALGTATVDVLQSAVYLPGASVLLFITLVSSLLIATGGSARDVLLWVQRILRAAWRVLAQRARVAGVRARMRLQRYMAARAERALLAEEADEIDSELVPRRVLPVKRVSREPEVVEHPPSPLTTARQEQLPFDSGALGPFKLPDVSLLAQGPDATTNFDREALLTNSRILEKKLADFQVTGRVVKVHPGPVITMYEFEPAPGIKVSRITNLADDLALALRAMAVRIVAPIPGKSVVGVEVPNSARDVVMLRDILGHASYQDSESTLEIALGKDIFGTPVTTDLGTMPHLLVAGATGTGKSVFLGALLCSLLFRARPDELKLLLIDPKMLEFAPFQGVPHLIADVVTNPKRAAAALMGIVEKMEERYALMAERGVRNIAQYNKQVAQERAQARLDAEEIALEPMPYIAVVVDELADLMIVAARDVEESLIRLAQMARAAGIHLVLATQRPSVDVLTGIIKANFPSRISFQVSSRTDSRTILDANGAERLLGMGDMLYVPPGTSTLTRIHGPYVSEKEINAVCDHLREQASPEFDPSLIRLKEESERREERGEEIDELFDAAVDIVARHRIASISFIQRKLKIGYNRSARIVEQMEAEGIVGPQEGTKAREIFVRPADQDVL